MKWPVYDARGYIRKIKYDMGADIYSLGVIIKELYEKEFEK